MNVVVVNPFEGLVNTLSQALAEIGPFIVSGISKDDILNQLGNQEAIIFCTNDVHPGSLELLKSIKVGTKFEDTPILVYYDSIASSEAHLFANNGASDTLQRTESDNDLLPCLGKLLRPQGAMDALNIDFFNAFATATVNIFEKMIGMPLARKNFYLKKDYKMFGFLSAIMGLSGSGEGSAVISIPKDLAFKLIARMVEMSPDELTTKEIHDGMGEIINMISGQAKGNLTESEFAFDFSLPTVVIGTGHEIIHREGTPCIVTVFATETGEEFALQVSLAAT